MTVRFGRHAFANVSGQILVSAIQVLMIPQYVRFIGIEAWGLFGFYLTVQGFAQMLDFGMSATVNREMARAATLPGVAARTRNFMRTSELGYGAIGLAIGAALFLAAPLIADRWFRLTTLTPATVTVAVRLIAALTAVQWPMTFYQGALLGLNRHGLTNTVRVATTVVSAGGSVLLLARVSPTIVTFFAWQVIVSTAQTALVAVLVWRNLPKAATGTPPRVEWSTVRGVTRFASGMMALTIAGAVFSQIDRVVLMRLVALQQFGYFTLGAVAGQGLNTMVSALFAAMFPTFSRLVAADDAAAIDAHYIQVSGIVTAVLVPIAAVVGLFSTDVIMVWTGSEITARIAAPVAALMVVGSALNGLMSVGYALQLARGETGLALRIYTTLCVVAAPAAVVLARRYGIVGGALVWPLINLLYVLLAVRAGARWFPRQSPVASMVRACVIPGTASVLAVWLLRMTMPMAGGRVFLLLQLGAAWLVAVAAAALVNPDLRTAALRYFRSRLRRPVTMAAFTTDAEAPVRKRKV
ncbi:MAG: oligosaccharide flippase family protein [Vicinamibacterales bacterium]